MKFDFKETTWRRVVVPPDQEQLVKEKLQNGEWTCANDIFNHIYHAHNEEIDGLDNESMIPDFCQGGESTVEIQVDGIVVWGNGCESELYKRTKNSEEGRYIVLETWPDLGNTHVLKDEDGVAYAFNTLGEAKEFGEEECQSPVYVNI